MVWCLLLVSLAAVLNVNVIFGAFMAGIVLGGMPTSEFEDAKEQISSFGLGFFVPIFFAIVGFRVNLAGAFDPTLFFGFLVFSTVIEGVCVFAAMRLARCSPQTSWHFAVAMNTRGGPGIVLASVAFDFGLIDERFFVALVLVQSPRHWRREPGSATPSLKICQCWTIPTEDSRVSATHG